MSKPLTVRLVTSLWVSIRSVERVYFAHHFVGHRAMLLREEGDCRKRNQQEWGAHGLIVFLSDSSKFLNALNNTSFVT
jgi:hypothetical protein